MGLTNLYVNNLSSLLVKHNFLSVYPYDLFPLSILNQQHPCSFIVNLSKSTEPGTHFVCIYVDNNNKLEYFDSYGLAPFLPRLINFITRNYDKRSLYNPYTIQNLSSYFCGYYCVAFLISKDLGWSIEDFYSVFNNPITNDEKVEKFLSVVIKQYYRNTR